MAKFSNITKSLIDLLNEHGENEFPPRQRNANKNFPLWVALRSAKNYPSKIDKVLSGGISYPFSTYSTPKRLITKKMLKQKSITAMQFALIDGYLCENGYYNGHWAVGLCEPPQTVIPIGRSNIYGKQSIVDDGVERWFLDVLEKIDKPITLRAILDSRVTDLILTKALDITVFLENEKQKKRKMLHLLSDEEARKRLHPKKNWMYSGA